MSQQVQTFMFRRTSLISSGFTWFIERMVRFAGLERCSFFPSLPAEKTGSGRRRLYKTAYSQGFTGIHQNILLFSLFPLFQTRDNLNYLIEYTSRLVD